MTNNLCLSQKDAQGFIIAVKDGAKSSEQKGQAHLPPPEMDVFIFLLRDEYSSQRKKNSTAIRTEEHTGIIKEGSVPKHLRLPTTQLTNFTKSLLYRTYLWNYTVRTLIINTSHCHFLHGTQFWQCKEQGLHRLRSQITEYSVIKDKLFGINQTSADINFKYPYNSVSKVFMVLSFYFQFVNLCKAYKDAGEVTGI